MRFISEQKLALPHKYSAKVYIKNDNEYPDSPTLMIEVEGLPGMIEVVTAIEDGLRRIREEAETHLPDYLITKGKT